MGSFISQCFTYLLTMDLLYFVAIGVAVLVVSALIRFIITLKEDDARIFKKTDRKTVRRRKSHKRRTRQAD